MEFAVMQPYFFPYIGYFSLIDSVDHFMFFDDVQYTKKSWMSRNRLLNIDKQEPYYIRPDLTKTPYQCLLPTVNLEHNGLWKNRLLAQLMGYKRAPFFEETFALVEQILRHDTDYLVQFNTHSVKEIANWLNITAVFDCYSDYDFWFDSKPGPGDWGREISNKIGATHYINSPGGEEFIFPEPFEDAGMKLGFIQPKIKPYSQFTEHFIPGLSILDVLMFNGRDTTSEMVKDYVIKWKN